MKRLERTSKSFWETDEDGRRTSRLEIRYSNRGEPYREGMEFALIEGEYDQQETVFLEIHELVELRDFLNKIIT